MDSEQETIADAPVIEAPPASEIPEDAPETEEPEQVGQSEDENAESGDAEEAEGQESAEDDLEDFEWNGQQIRGPKGLKDAVMMHGDYTRKTQEVAERRRQLDAVEQQIRQRAEASDEIMELRAQQWAQDSQLRAYENIDWQAWAEQDPIESQKNWYRYQELHTKQAETARKLDGMIQSQHQAAQQEFAKRVDEVRDHARKNIKGFTPEIEKKVVDFALAQGVTQGQLQANLNPVVFDILHKAMIGAEVMNKSARPPQKAAVPLKTVSSRSNSPVRKSLADMDMDEYVAAAKKQGRIK